MRRALDFIAWRQKADGSFEEEDRFRDMAPPWCKPGDPSACLYLTANCGYWQAFFGAGELTLEPTVRVLRAHLEDGHLPSFLHADWLAAGTFVKTGETQAADGILAYLEARLPEMDSSPVAWMITSLAGMGMAKSHPLLLRARRLLEEAQEEDGRWKSEDGPQRDVHVTLESLRALS